MGGRNRWNPYLPRPAELGERMGSFLYKGVKGEYYTYTHREMSGIMKEHKSWQKDKVIKGMVIDNPRSVHWEYAEGTFFLMELGQDVTAKFGKKLDDVTLDQGETVVIGGVVRCYIRKNDQIELKGQVVKLVHDDRARGESIYIRADKVYNETLKFSLDY